MKRPHVPPSRTTRLLLDEDPHEGNQIVLCGGGGHDSFKILTPHVSLRKDIQLNVPWRYLSAMTCVPEPNVIAFGYQKQRKDPDFNKKFHQSVNGMISAYRWGTLKMYKALKRSGTQINDSLIRQAKWAEVDLLYLQRGLSRYDDFSVDMLNQKYMVSHVKGCDDEEMACFLRKISNCDVFHIASRPLKVVGSVAGDLTCVGYDITIKFGDESQPFKFGSIADLSMDEE